MPFSIPDKGYPPLQAWHDLFLLTSAAAATLVGLLFVVITLVAERRPATNMKSIHIYLTPTVVYFASVLLLAAVLIFPTQSRLSTALSCSIAGALGFVYALSLLRERLRGARFFQRGDRWYYALLPALSFVLLAAGGFRVFASDPGLGLTLTAVAILALLALALRNSWAIAVTIISHLPESDHKKTRE